MPLNRTKEEVYDRCLTEGSITQLETVETDKIKANLKIAEGDLDIATDALAKNNWNTLYKLKYDALHGLVESFLCFDKVKSLNHLCLFAYLCVKHPELELNWDFFEKVRTKRNGINYYGTPVTEKDWKEVSLEFQLNIDLFKRKIEEKLTD